MIQTNPNEHGNQTDGKEYHQQSQGQTHTDMNAGTHWLGDVLAAVEAPPVHQCGAGQRSPREAQGKHHRTFERDEPNGIGELDACFTAAP